MSHGKSKQKVHCDKTSIKQIEKKFNGQNFFLERKFFFKPVAPPEIEKLLNVLIRIKPQE